MDIKEILSLDMNMASAKKIDHFLSQTDKYTTEYLKAFCYKMIIWGENNRINDALKEVYSYVPYFSEMLDDDVIIICDTIMRITLRANRLDEYQKYLTVKIGRLPASRLKEKYLDFFYYYLALKDYNQARINALEYLKFNISKDEAIKINLELLHISELLRDEATFKDARLRLDELYKDSFDFEDISSYHLRVLKMLFVFKSYSEAKSFAKEFLNNPHITNDDKIEAATINLKIMLLEHEYKKGTIFESEYVDILPLASPKISLEFSQTALKLYKALDHRISIEYYENLISEYEDKLKDAKKANKKKKEELIIIPDIMVEKPVAKNKDLRGNLDLVSVEEDNTLTTNLSPKMNQMIKALDKLLSFNLPLRDSIREGIGLVDDTLGIKELDILYFSNEYKLHKYKNKRVYDRSYEILDDSLQKRTLEKRDIVYFALDNLHKEIDLFYLKPIEYSYAISFPLKDSDTFIGIMTIYSNKDMLNDPELFTSLAFLRSIYNLVIVKDMNKNEFLLSHSYESYIFNNMSLGYRIIHKNKMELSSEGAYLLDLNSDSTLNDFYLSLSPEDKNSYEELLKHLKENPENNVTITYRYEKNYKVKYFKETFFTYFNEELKILSVFEDITKNILEVNSLNKSLNHYLDTNLYNKNKLYQDIKEYKTGKYTLALFSLANFENYRDIYGNSFYVSFTRALAKALKDYFKNKYYVDIYQVSEFLFALMIKNNLDKRLLQTKIKELIAYLEVSLVDFNYNIDLNYNMGLLRISPNDNTDLNLIYDHLYDAYLLAKEEYVGESNYEFFSTESYKKHFKNRVIETNISEALDTNKIEVLYQQIVDIKESLVYGYYARLNIVDRTFNEDDINEVIKLKDLEERLDKYKLMHVASDLRRIYSELKGYCEIFLELSNVTINNTIKKFILAQLSFFKIPANMINIIVDKYDSILDDLKAKHIGIVTKNIYDIINHKANRILLNYNEINLTELKNMISFLEGYGATVILGGVNETKLGDLAKENVRYLYGDIYKKSYTMVDLISKLKA